MSRLPGRVCTALVSLCFVVATALGTASTAAATAHGQTSIVLTTRNSPTIGAYLTSSHGFTLYTFTLDTAGKSACSGACAKLWPPLLVPKGAKLSRIIRGVPASRLGTIKRSNGTRQLTYEGKPLYLFAGDKHPGQTAGQGVDNIWFVALVKPSKTATAAPTASPTTTAAPAAQPTAGPSASGSGPSGSSSGATSNNTSPPPTNAPSPPPTTQAPAPPPTTQPPAPPTTTLPPVGGGGGYGY